MYSGHSFAGDPRFVACAEQRQSLSPECKDLKVCFGEGTASEDVISSLLDDLVKVPVRDGEAMVQGFLNGECNVIGADPPPDKQFFVDNGYQGDYAFGTKVLSKDPLTIVTRGDDVEFADFCNWIVRSLFAADVMNITQERANEFPKTHVFGTGMENVFTHAIAASGNYGEIYERTTEPYYPREEFPFFGGIHNGTTGLLYAFPFGNLERNDPNDVGAPGPAINGTLESIASQDVLRCGVVSGIGANQTIGFAIFNETVQEWQGMDIDFCRAISAATNVDRLEVVPLSSSQAAFVALMEWEIDIFAGAPYNMDNDVLEPSTGIGFSFSPCYFFGQKSDEDEDVPYALSIATREDDIQFSGFVRWIVWALIYAEEVGISSTNAQDMPTVGLFGPDYQRMFRSPVFAVGNYGDCYSRNLESLIPRSGPNRLNNGEYPLINPWLASFGF